jgi:hypothetical protein
MNGNLFRAVSVAYREFSIRHKHLKDYYIGVGHGGNDGIRVVFHLCPSDTGSYLLGCSSISYWIDKRTFTIKRIDYYDSHSAMRMPVDCAVA